MATVATTTEKTESKPKQQPKAEPKPQRSRADEKFKIFCGTANEQLTDEICAFLGLERGKAPVTRFSNGEFYVQLMENVRGAGLFACQPTCVRADEHLSER